MNVAFSDYMKRVVVILCMLMLVLPAVAQEFIGCQVVGGWGETPKLRKRFVLSKKESKQEAMRLEVTSLGYHEVYVNGEKVGDEVMQPAVSQLNKRAMTVTYDVKRYLHEGENEILLWIGQGWGRIYNTPAVVMAEISTDIGTKIVQTDGTWEASPSGYSYTGSWQPLQFGGERYDARIQDDWKPAKTLEVKDVVVTHQEFKGNHIIDTLKPVSITQETDSTLLLDFGRDLTGWFQVDFMPMNEGDEVKMEYLDHLKSTDTESDIFISDGTEKGHFSNRFHTHSFRFVRLTGCKVICEAKALQISALNPQEGATFECSDERLNAVHNLIRYTLQCLTFSGYMVDCPHLERMGYGGDGNSSTMTLQTLWDVRDTYRNWLTAWEDAIDSIGSLPYVAPAFRTGGGPYWSGFIIKAPWRTYLNYGDRTLIDRHYEQMKLWLSYVERFSPDGLLESWPEEGRTWFLGDWLAPDSIDVGGESALFVSNCFIAECLSDMEQMAMMKGQNADAQRFAEWRTRLVANIHHAYYHPESQTYANGTPLDLSYALLTNIPPNDVIKEAIREQLLEDSHRKYKDHIAVGLMGVPIFTEWVIRERQSDLMATILRQSDYPGYLYMIENGATTTWEAWNGDRSRIHNCYNGIGIWFYQALAGICPDPKAPGYRHFFIDPQPVEGVNWVRASKPTIYGTIQVEINGKRLHISVPDGTTATIFPNTPQERNVGSGDWDLTIE